jgi:predicted esterase YcpF (UPF0227 family)
MYLKSALFAKYAYSKGRLNTQAIVTFDNFGDYTCKYYIKKNAEFYTISNNHEIYFSFRGTSDSKDVLDVIKLWEETDSDIGNVHAGFYEMAVSLLPLVNSIILKNANKKIYFVGHSLGGAIAKLIGLKRQDLTDLTVITFGEPRTCREKFYVHKQKYVRFINNTDLAPRVQYHMAFGIKNETVIYLNRKGDHIINPSKTYMLADAFMTILRLPLNIKNNSFTDHSMDSYIKAIKT